MKKIITRLSIIIIIIIFITLIVFSAISYFKIKKITNENIQLDISNKKFIEENKKSIEIYQKEILDRTLEINKLKKNIKIITQNQLNNMDNNEKDNIILKLQKDNAKILFLYDSLLINFNGISDDLYNTNDTLEKTTFQLNKTTNELNKINKKFGVGLYAMGGISGLNNKIKIDLIIGADALFNFFYNRVGLTAGIYVKPYEDVGLGGKIGLNVFIK